MGTGDAFNARGCGHPAYLVTTPSTRFLLDCGATTLLGLKQAGLASCDIDSIIVSHLHGDHTAGIPFLLLECVFETPRKGPLTVVGPPGTRNRIEALYGAAYQELSTRELPFECRYIEVQPGERRRVGDIDLLPFRVPHQKNEISLGFRVTIDGKTILYSGDTGWTEELVVQSQDTDLFICECSYFDTRVDNHLDYPRLAENHHRFGCRRLILSHLGREMHARREEVELEVATDGLIVEV